MDPALAVEVNALSRLKALNIALKRGDSPIQQFYSMTTVFITGGTGFLGKQLLEKLFRACDIEKVYLLVRPKKGKSAEERIKETLQDSVFDMVREDKPDFAKKIHPVEGDVAELRLGLSDKDWKKLTEEVDVIFHAAATTKFDETLRVATLINIRGTREMLALGQACQKLKSFVHVSTAYVNATDGNLQDYIREDFYSSPLPPDMMVDLAERLDLKRMSDIEADLIQDYPNTYTFAKALAEEEVRAMEGKLPICIVRPAIVISSYREPSPGWADMSCAYGASGLILGPATGLIHVLYAGQSTRFSLVPVDYVNNALIVAGWATANKPSRTIDIYSVSSARNLFSWETIITRVRKVGEALPTPLAVWYIFATYTGNKWLYLLLSCILHYIPGLVLDAVCTLLGRPQMFIKLYHKVYKAQLALSYFTTNTWIFDDSNTDQLYKSLTENDKLIFNFDTTNIDQHEYLTIWCFGLRKYLIKDGIKDTKFARKKQFWLRYLHYIVSVMYFYVLWRLFKWFILNLLCILN